jgi:hypothetical protein
MTWWTVHAMARTILLLPPASAATADRCSSLCALRKATASDQILLFHGLTVKWYPRRAGCKTACTKIAGALMSAASTPAEVPCAPQPMSAILAIHTTSHAYIAGCDCQQGVVPCHYTCAKATPFMPSLRATDAERESLPPSTYSNHVITICGAP